MIWRILQIEDGYIYISNIQCPIANSLVMLYSRLEAEKNLQNRVDKSLPPQLVSELRQGY